MNKIITLFIAVFFLVSVVQAEQKEGINSTLPWEEGQIVAETDSSHDTALFNYRVYRLFLKKVPDGYLVQELYKDSNNKATDPFVIEKMDDVTRVPYAYYTVPESELSITGAYTLWYENGTKMQDGNYVNGKKDGLWTRWFNTGQKNAEGMYKLGKLEGLWRMWNVDGSNMNETFYKNGRLEAVLSDIKEDQKSKLGSLNDNKTDRNIWLVWDENGHLKSQVMLVNGKKEGTWVSWDDRGKREMLGYYKNDKRDGVWKTFWLDDAETKRSEGQYKNGKKEGVWIFWDKYGNKIKEERYNQGKLTSRVNLQ